MALGLLAVATKSARVGALEVVSTPSRHASGRLKPESDLTLWSGFAMRGPAHRVWYSGDTGFFPGMREIGERLGPFDLTLIESGQYDAEWPDWHLGPEQAVEAHRLVRGKVMQPVHWGLFKLAQHGWTEPAERVLAAAKCAGVSVITPQPGMATEPGDATTAATSTGHWWPQTRWMTAAERPFGPVPTIVTSTMNPSIASAGHPVRPSRPPRRAAIL